MKRSSVLVSLSLTAGTVLTVSLLSTACGDNLTRVGTNDAYEAGAVAPLACVPNLDGKIDSSEFPTSLNVEEHFLVNPTGTTRTIDLTGRVDSDGVRVWDYSVPFTDDQIATIVAEKPDGKWFASTFPDAQFVGPLDLAGRTMAVYSRTDDSVNLLGIASTDENPAEGKTLYAYNPPIQLYKLPLVPGETHTSTGTIQNATLRGQPYAGRDTYEVTVDGSGKVILPDITFTQALRVRTLITIEPIAGVKTTQRQVSFFFECFGEVARATSAYNEPDENFSNVAELRRFGLAAAN